MVFSADLSLWTNVHTGLSWDLNTICQSYYPLVKTPSLTPSTNLSSYNNISTILLKASTLTFSTDGPVDSSQKTLNFLSICLQFMYVCLSIRILPSSVRGRSVHMQGELATPFQG